MTFHSRFSDDTPVLRLMKSEKVSYIISYKNSQEKMTNLTFRAKRNLTVASFSLRMICMGIEFAVIFPSVWLYLKIFHVDYWYLGLVLSAYNMVGIVSTVLVGRLADATRKIRFTGFLWNIAEIAGNIIYALHFHVAFPLLGRMVAGFGEGFISAMWGELARITTKEQRTRYFAILKGSNLLGAAIGPALNLFLKEFNFKIAEWHIDFRTSPGFFMGIVWVFITIIMLVFVYDLSSEGKENTAYTLLAQEKEVAETVGSLISGSITPQQPREEGGIEQEAARETEAEGNGKNYVLSPEIKSAAQLSSAEEAKKQEWEVSSPEETDTKYLVSDAENHVDDDVNKKSTFKAALLDMFTKFEVNVLVYLLFFMYVTHTCLQGITPLVAERMLKWNETKVSIVYTVWGLEIIAVLIIVWVVSPKIADRVILMSAVICGNLTSVSLIVLSYSKPQSNLCYYSFLITILLGGVGISITVVVGRSLVSKHTRAENQGLVHAILTSFNRLAGLTGPIFGSSLYTHKTVMGCLIGGVQLLGLILLVAVFSKLKTKDESHSGKKIVN